MTPFGPSLVSLSAMLASQRQERVSTLTELMNNLEQIKCRIKRSETQEITELLEQAIDQCQLIKMLN
ncbi:hypothetical protein VB715_17745 [Crocosphaera sp. UHCC 0190]|uniref:hypothetical protein n=1 Tax=Crocosphaera sp. UHCC 0190 TaxID=3110246 RepID=UPI002B20A877|nr:hypothetical protein [Crocosphaera sp. UHCC 0190]MEA5511620.1 hypothetical protein [Crocosphaera sp. UHCC 0190]